MTQMMSQGHDGESMSTQGHTETERTGHPSFSCRSSGCCSNRMRWLILVMCCIMGFTSWGLALGMGSVLNDVMDTFKVSRAPAALVQSLCLGVCLMGGLVVGPILHRFGPRVTVVGGSLVAAVGSVIAFFATNIAFVIIGMGVLTGAGISSNFLTGHVIGPLMFHDLRSVVLALVSASSGAGSIVYPLFFRYLVNTYALRGAYLIVGGINLQMALFGVLIGACLPHKQDIAKSDTKKEKEEETIEKEGSQGARVEESSDHETIFTVCGSSLDPELKDSSSEILRDGCATQKDESAFKKTEDACGKKQHEPGDFSCVSQQGKSEEQQGRQHRHTEHGTPPEVTHEGQVQLTSQQTTTDQQDHRRGQVQIQTEAPIKPVYSAYLAIFRNCRFVAFFLLGSPPVLLFNATPLFFLVDLATSDGLNVVDGSFFLSMMAVGNVAGRLLAGILHYVLDSRIVTAHCVCMITTAISSFCFTLVDSYTGYVAISVVYGLNWGFLTTCISMSTLEIVGRDTYAVALGIATFTGGIGMSVSGPVGGMFRDQTGSFLPMFYIGLAQGIVSGCVLITSSCWPRQRQCCCRNHDSFHVTSQYKVQ